MWGGEGSRDTGEHVDRRSDRGWWSEAVGHCFLECDLVMGLEAVEQLVWAEAWIYAREVPEGDIVSEFV